jgi:inhibitor of cysteine peptidase
MRRVPLLLVLAMLVVLSLGACATRIQEPVTVVERDSGSMVELRIGGMLVVVLDANPSTGHLWEIESKDMTVIRQDGEPEFKADSDVPGAAGTLTMRFEAVAAGKEWLRLVYHRPFEEGSQPAKTFELHVVVK